MIIVDGHQDLAWNALTFKRDYLRPAAETRRLEAGTQIAQWNGDTLLGWDDWVAARNAIIFATLFATPLRWQEGPWDTLVYQDSEQAHRLYSQQLDFYHRLVDENPQKFTLIQGASDLQPTLATWADDPPGDPQIGLVLMIEGADGVRHPQELAWWAERGVRIVGPAWSGTRYSGGTDEPGPLTSEGMELLDVMADLGLILDVSHMAEEAAFQALERYPGTIIASHCVAGALVPDAEKPDRHLSDDAIRLLIERDSAIGIVFANHFLANGRLQTDPRVGVTLEHAANHIDHICQLAGSARHAAFGTDFDGGFGLQHIPLGIDTIADLQKIDSVLMGRGYSPADIEAIFGGNWLRLLSKGLPENS